ncbi:hypothetical protein SynWH8101_2079 [Synechococcus sp. WH 8101]|uniref:hypothetical protein n=1 Tax=Synechococcus sp. WH 8101 TaxID=59932 RepID=UPI0010248CC6|nr:hypothetical protein [Synechococcus sp. WH 8101]QBE69660.1 hypothetical protein SynWH8101_2079 [Synechococcus sp. WH 8101]QNI45912.1 putative membrane protein [Synechococcus sp. WH 8101]
MALLPRWHYMTDQSKALVKRTAVSLLVLLIAAILLRGLLPWVLLAVIVWFVWSWLSRR